MRLGTSRVGLRLAEDAQKLVGEGGEDFLKSCWRRGAVSQSQKEAWGPPHSGQGRAWLKRRLGGIGGQWGKWSRAKHGGPQPQPASSSGPPPQVFCSSSRNGWSQGLSVTPLRWPLQPQPFHHPEAPAPRPAWCKALRSCPAPLPAASGRTSAWAKRHEVNSRQPSESSKQSTGGWAP